LSERERERERGGERETRNIQGAESASI